MVGSAEGIEVVGEASDGAEAIALAEVLVPDVVLMDLRMPRMDGVAALREFARRGIPSRVVVLTTFDADADVLPAIAAGATGYLLKDASRDELLTAIRGAAAGRTVLSPEVASRLVGRVRTPEASLLTPRELEILGLIADGATNRAAGDRLHVSEGTVKTHLLSIYAKLGVGDRASAVAEGFRRGFLDTTR
ncbi:DNA-binding response regulator [Microbacterium sp. MYb64]|nr:DNA-binding response regulator [Microbacterium sp. MYb64]